MSLWCKQIASSATILHFPFFSLSKIPKARAIAAAAAAAATLSSSNPQTLTLTPAQTDQISLYVRTLLQWNQRMNLTAVTEEGEVMTRHVEDSLALISPLKRSYASHCKSRADGDEDALSLNLVDVGSGAGLPGLIFAIACPSWKITLLESMQKRCLFLEHVVDLIGLSNVEILRERAEDRTQANVLTSENHLMSQ